MPRKLFRVPEGHNYSPDFLTYPRPPQPTRLCIRVTLCKAFSLACRTTILVEHHIGTMTRQILIVHIIHVNLFVCGGQNSCGKREGEGEYKRVLRRPVPYLSYAPI